MASAPDVPTVFVAAPRMAGAAGLFGDADYARQRGFFTTVPATPLVDLPHLAAGAGVGRLWVKDETARFGLPAFKSLGVEFAVDALARSGALDGVGTLACASAGNHGRAVARAARVRGLAARIFLDADVAPARVVAIAAEGATIVRVAGTYDDAVREATADAAAIGAQVVSDTSWDGYERIPRDIMLGYTRVMDEAEAAWQPHPRPDVVCVQGGVGGLVAAVASWNAWRFGDDRPRLIAVEPTRAACLQASARAGRPVRVDGPLTTIMAGLRCGEVSPAAFAAVQPLVDAYVAIDDAWCRQAMRALARPVPGEPTLAVGTSGAAGVAALLALAATAPPDLREALGLTPEAVVLTIATEGMTEPDLWREVTAG